MTFLALWIIGILMVFLEFYLPGAVLGTIGGFLLIGSIIMFAQKENALWTAGYIMLVSASLVAVIKYALWKIPHSKAKDSIYSNDAQVGYYASSYDKTMIGKEGIVLSDLKPGGYILIDDQQLPAISESGYIVQGDHVKVLRGEGDSLIVTKIKG
jgi:membrane-bound ClpP family serine protease